ncbi:DM13 domain-containing protein [Nocardia camponoti]|uniref:DM13 domain-containing protein n=1 Tax=Nocardia camponoti TaxID=1616106 RepID=A0A917Q7W2_9NOCA|nr:DM13 domain-containing protein [Nocardia camponoti]GGK34565.1 hypothetical protein GCM10011591_02760 [Nocardia camponoti]
MKRLWLVALGAIVVVGLIVALSLFQPWRLFTTTRVDEAPIAAATNSAGAPVPPLAHGTLISHEHETSGTVTIASTVDGTVLRLTDLRTSDGPALHVYLTDQPVTPDDWHNADDGTYLDLGPLQGNEGNQNYSIPPGTDLSRFTGVSIWCARFHVSFGAATLVS